jgi:hypothetical protein
MRMPRAGGRERSQSYTLVVAAPQKLRQRDFGDGRAGRRRGPRHRAEDPASQDGRVHEAPGHAVEPGREPREHLLGQSRAEKNLTHPDEQRRRTPRSICVPERGEEILGGDDSKRGEPDRAHAAGDREVFRPDARCGTNISTSRIVPISISAASPCKLRRGAPRSRLHTPAGRP